MQTIGKQIIFTDTNSVYTITNSTYDGSTYTLISIFPAVFNESHLIGATVKLFNEVRNVQDITLSAEMAVAADATYPHGASLKLAQQGATTGQSLTWNGTQYAPSTVSTSITSPNLTIDVGGTATARTLDVDIPAETIRIDGEIAGKIGVIGASLPLTITTVNTTTVPFNRFSNTVTSVDLATASLAAGDAFLMSIGSVLTGNTWSAPTTNTYIGATATPGTAVGKILGAEQAGSILQLYVARNTAEALRSGPYTLYAGPEKFNFVTPPQTEIIRLAQQNTTSNLPFDIISWTNDGQVQYVSDKSITPVVASIQALSSPISSATWEFNVPSLAGFTDDTEVIGSDASGKTITGLYRVGIGSGKATLQQINYERLSNFLPNQLYSLTWRQGIIASAAFYTDSGTAGTGNRKVSTLAPGTNITITEDSNFPGRSIISSTGGGTSPGSPWTYLAVVAGDRTYTIPPGFTTITAIVVLNGAVLIPTTDYTIAGDVLTLDSSITILTGDKLGIAATGNAAANGVTSLNTLTGALAVTSSDNSVAITALGTNVNLSVQGGGGSAGVATGYNVGNYVPGNMLVYSGNLVPPGTAANEGQVQIGTGTGYSTNSTVIANAPAAMPTQGWVFGGQQANNVVVELGAQKQIFRLGVSGTWNTTPQVLPIYGQTGVIKQPIFLRYNTDFDSGYPFPGLITASGSAAPLVERSTVNATARYCTNLGLTCQTGTFGGQTAIGLVSLASVSGAANTPVLIFNTTTALTQTNLGGTSGNVTIPLEVYVGGQWVYLGAEWQVSAYTLNTNQIQITLTDAGSYNGLPVRIQNGASTPLLAWYTDLPPSGTVFGSSLAAAAGYVEVHLSANVWTADTATYKPQGFLLPNATEAPRGYNFNWTTISGAAALNTLSYWHYNLADQYDPDPSNTPNWNNRVTVNYGTSGSSIPGNLWDTWALNWSSVPMKVVSDNTATNGTTMGNVISYTYNGIIRYRFIPATYSPTGDAFYAVYQSATKTVVDLLTARST